MTFTVMWIVWKSWDGRLVFGDCGRRVKFLGRLDFEKMTGSAFLFFLFLFHFYPLVKNECSRCAKNISSNEYFYVWMGVGHCCGWVQQWLLMAMKVFVVIVEPTEVIMVRGDGQP